MVVVVVLLNNKWMHFKPDQYLRMLMTCRRSNRPVVYLRTLKPNAARGSPVVIRSCVSGVSR